MSPHLLPLRLKGAGRRWGGIQNSRPTLTTLTKLNFVLSNFTSQPDTSAGIKTSWYCPANLVLNIYLVFIFIFISIQTLIGIQTWGYFTPARHSQEYGRRAVSGFDCGAPLSRSNYSRPETRYVANASTVFSVSLHPLRLISLRTSGLRRRDGWGRLYAPHTSQCPP